MLMKLIPLLSLSALVLLSACAARPQPTATPTPPPPTPTLTPTPVVGERPGWTLVWHDEFEGDTLNRDHWTFDLGGHGWGNDEWESYTERPENARVENGLLVIEAHAEVTGNRNYSSARLKTQGLHAWQFGRVEARLKLPSGQGLWPAFWMLGEDISSKGWPDSGEIDIMEFIGREPGHIYGTVHGPGYSGAAGIGSSVMVDADSLKNDFHVYAIEWEPTVIRWYLDEQVYFILTADQVPGTWVFDHPFFIILNLAVGGRWPGYPDASTVFPQTLQVDYVRVYQK